MCVLRCARHVHLDPMGSRKQYERTTIKIWEETMKKQASNQLIRSHRIIWWMSENKHLETESTEQSSNGKNNASYHTMKTWYMVVKNGTTRSSIRQYSEGGWIPHNHPVQNNDVHNMLNGAMEWYDEGDVPLPYQFDDLGHSDNSSSANGWQDQIPH